MKFLQVSTMQALRGKVKGEAEGASAPHSPAKVLCWCDFLLMSPLNVFSLKELTKNIHENQQVKSRASWNKT